MNTGFFIVEKKTTGLMRGSRKPTVMRQKSKFTRYYKICSQLTAKIN